MYTERKRGGIRQRGRHKQREISQIFVLTIGFTMKTFQNNVALNPSYLSLS